MEGSYYNSYSNIILYSKAPKKLILVIVVIILVILVSVVGPSFCAYKPMYYIVLFAVDKVPSVCCRQGTLCLL